MKRGPLWQICATTAPEAEDAVSAWLEGLLGQPAASYTEVETQLATITISLSRRPDWSAARRRELAAGLRRIRACGLDTGPERIWLRKVPAQDWAESWKRHFRPMAIGSALLLKPSWSRRQPRPGQQVLVLDPGLSFGTGRHPTTAFCLRQLVARRRPERPQSFLDAGTGSGILAIAAAKLGYAPIEAFDFDPDAIRVARANARRNGVAGGLHLFRRDAARLPLRPARRYSLVCANLLGDLLLAQRQRLAAQVQTGGVLVLSGILKTEFACVQTAFEALGLRLAASRVDQEWRSGAFIRLARPKSQC
jgi:ribosomal protein L11 methyltransferase